nr:hypothetical protein Q903MT_gene5182 [Picea sitchensis]
MTRKATIFWLRCAEHGVNAINILCTRHAFFVSSVPTYKYKDFFTDNVWPTETESVTNFGFRTS